MADLSITTANVAIFDTTSITRTVQFGETMAPGDPCYLKASDQKYWKADANASAAAATAKGIVLVGAATDVYGVIVESGPMNVGATLTVGVPYIVSTNAGKIAPASDFSGYSGATQCHLGYAATTSKLIVKPFLTGASN